MACPYSIPRLLCFYRDVVSELMPLATVQLVDTLSDRVCCPIALPWRTHLYQTIHLTLLPSHLSKSNIPYTDLGPRCDGHHVGRILLLRDAVRMLSDFPSLDNVLWPASEMLRVSSDVLCDWYHKHDYGYHDSYDPMAYDMEVTDALAAKDCCYKHFPSRWAVSINSSQP